MKEVIHLEKSGRLSLNEESLHFLLLLFSHLIVECCHMPNTVQGAEMQRNAKKTDAILPLQSLPSDGRQ